MFAPMGTTLYMYMHYWYVNKKGLNLWIIGNAFNFFTKSSRGMAQDRQQLNFDQKSACSETICDMDIRQTNFIFLSSADTVNQIHN